MNKLNEENIPSLSEADVQLLFDNTVYNDDELARALFHRPADYVINTCNNCWLDDRNYFMERLVLRTCFMKRNTSWSNARLNPGAYLLGLRESANAMRREGKPLMDWYLDVKECLEYMEQNGYAKLYKPSFFESIDRNFSDINQIKQIAMDENLTDDQKCEKLWDRDYDTFIYSGLLNMQTYSKLPHEMKERLYNGSRVTNNVSLARQKVFGYKLDFGIQEFCLTHDSGEYEPLTVAESFMIYSERDPSGNTPYNRYNQYNNRNWKEHYDIMTWWEYIKKSIETYEEFDILPGKYKTTFFENRININNLSVSLNEERNSDKFTNSEEIKDIVENDSLTDDEKSKILFEEPFDYISNTVNLNLTKKYDQSYSTHACHNSACWTVFCKDDIHEPLTIKQSFEKYALHSGNTPLGWYNDIVSSLIHWEAQGVAKPYKTSFFENLTSEKFNSLDNNLIKRVILKYVKEHGYLRGGYGYSNPNGASYRGSPTVAAITSLLDNNAEDLQPIACSPEELEKMNIWVNNIIPADIIYYVDYFRKGIEVWHKEHLTKSDLPLVCSFCNTYFNSEKRLVQQREREQRQREHEMQVQSPSNVHAGQVGDVIQFVIAEANITRWISPGFYATKDYPLWKIKDTQGKIYYWSDTKNETELEPGMLIEAKIKELLNLKGINSTKIWKLKIMQDDFSTSFFS